jgi:hypothetical protein
MKFTTREQYLFRTAAYDALAHIGVSVWISRQILSDALTRQIWERLVEAAVNPREDSYIRQRALTALKYAPADPWVIGPVSKIRHEGTALQGFADHALKALRARAPVSIGEVLLNRSA